MSLVELHVGRKTDLWCQAVRHLAGVVHGVAVELLGNDVVRHMLMEGVLGELRRQGVVVGRELVGD